MRVGLHLTRVQIFFLNLPTATYSKHVRNGIEFEELIEIEVWLLGVWLRIIGLRLHAGVLILVKGKKIFKSYGHYHNHCFSGF